MQTISKSLIRKYIDSVVYPIIIDFGAPEPDPAVYEQSIFDDLLTWVKVNKNEAQLKLGIQHLLLSHSFKADEFQNNDYPWDENELRVVLKEMYRRLWPNEPLPAADQIFMVWVE